MGYYDAGLVLSLLSNASLPIKSSNLASIPFKFDSTLVTFSSMLFSTSLTESSNSANEPCTLFCSSSNATRVLAKDDADV